MSQSPAELPSVPWTGPKDYLYVSKTKVDHLGGQSPETLRDKVDVTVGIDLKGLGNAEIGSRPREPTLFQRAEDLCEALRKAGKVGDLSEDDKPYVQGTMFARGFWSRQISGHADVVLFTALISAIIIVGLGGSAFHTLERPEERLQRWSNSGHAALLKFLNWQSQYIGDDQSKMTSPWYHEMLETDSDKAAPREEIEFVAQRLDVHDGKDEHLGFRAVLGRPIYVARTGRHTTSRMNRNYEALRDLFWQQRGLNGRRGRRNRRVHANRSYRTPPEFDPQLPPACYS